MSQLDLTSLGSAPVLNAENFELTFDDGNALDKGSNNNTEGGQSHEDVGPPPGPLAGMVTSRRKIWKLCSDYLQGVWKTVSEDDLVIKQISGGLSNLIFHVSLPDYAKISFSKRNPEVPKEVLLRLYGAKFNSNSPEVGTSDKVLENVIFCILAERKLGPKLYGVFPEGRLEEFIQARPLSNDEMRDTTDIRESIARNLAKIHDLTVPMNKTSDWLFSTLKRYASQVRYINLEEVMERNYDKAEKLMAFNFEAEVDLLRRVLSRINSPVVFCHNDCQSGNILHRKSFKTLDDKLLFIDYEFANYNYRAFDLANHFSELVYDYTNPDYPFYHCRRKNFPSRERQFEFFRAYLSVHQLAAGSLRPNSPTCGSPTSQQQFTVPGSPKQSTSRTPRTRHLSCDQQAEILWHEVQAFLLAPPLLWCMWGIIQSTNTKIPFGYWDYAEERMRDYQNHKKMVNHLFEAVSGTTGRKKRTFNN